MDSKYVNSSFAEYEDEEGNVYNLYDLRDEIESACIDFAQYKQQGRKWLKEYGKYASGKQGENYRDAIGQYLFLQCLYPLQAGLSRTNVMSAVGMYIGMSLVYPGVKGQYKTIMKSGCDNILGVLESSDKTKNSKLHTFVEKIRDKQAFKINNGKVPYTPMSAAIEYLRIENAAYSLMRESQDRIVPPTRDHVTEAYYDYQTISQRDDVSSEVVSFYKCRFEQFQRAACAWDDLSDDEKRDVYVETVRADADSAKEILYQMANKDGISQEMIKDTVAHMVGNALVRDAQSRKEKRGQQRNEHTDVVDEIKDAYKNGIDPEVSGIADVFNQTSYGVGCVETNEFDSILDQDVDDNGVIRSVIKNKWDGEFKNTMGSIYKGDFEARTPLNVYNAPLSVCRVMDVYVKNNGIKSASNMLSAIKFVEAGSAGQDLDRAYIESFGDMFSGKSHEDVKSMRNLVTDLSHTVDQMKRDGIDQAQIQSICLTGYRASIFNAYLEENLGESMLKDDVKAALVQNAFSDANMCVSHNMDASTFESEIVPARCRAFYDVLSDGEFCADKTEAKKATQAYGRFLFMFREVLNKENESCKEQGVSYSVSQDVFVKLISNYSADKCGVKNKDDLEIRTDMFNNRVIKNMYDYVNIKETAHAMKEDNKRWYNSVVNDNYEPNDEPSSEDEDEDGFDGPQP